MSRRLPTLRARIVAASVLGTLVVLVAAGVMLLAATGAGERDAVDERLERRAALVASATAASPNRRIPGGGILLSFADLGVEVRHGGAVVQRVGTLPVDAAPAPAAGSLGRPRTLTVNGTRWRAYAAPVYGPPADVTVQVLTPASTAEAPVARLRRRLLVVGAAGLAVAGLLAWMLGRAATTALERLRGTTDEVTATERLDLRALVAGPREVAAVATALNALLARLQRSSAERDRALEATRRFAADAGHELRTPLAALQATLETLDRHPDLPAEERSLIVADAVAEQQRLATLVASLQSLTRAEAGQMGDERPVDLVAVAREAIAALPPVANGSRVDLDLLQDDRSADGVTLPSASPTGVRLLVDNLIRNAVQHGRRGDAPAHVRLALRRGVDDRIHLTVDDAGPGIPPDERARVLDRFYRGSSAAGHGSGLGLAIAEQQAQLLGGTLAVAASPDLGGARIEVVLPTVASGGADGPMRATDRSRPSRYTDEGPR